MLPPRQVWFYYGTASYYLSKYTKSLSQTLCREQKLLFNSNAESLLAVSENISLIYFAGEKIDTRYSIDDYLLRPCWKRTVRYNLILVFVNRRFVKANVNNTQITWLFGVIWVRLCDVQTMVIGIIYQCWKKFLNVFLMNYPFSNILSTSTVGSVSLSQ